MHATLDAACLARVGKGAGMVSSFFCCLLPATRAGDVDARASLQDMVVCLPLKGLACACVHDLYTHD